MANTPAAHQPAPGENNANTIVVEVKPADTVVDKTVIHCFDKEGEEKHQEIGKYLNGIHHCQYKHVKLTLPFSREAHGRL